MNEEQYTEMFKYLVEMERRYSENLRILADRIKHPVMKALLIGIANDSEKHAQFYTAIIELITKYQPAISQEEFKILKEEIEKHIETELKMIETTKQLFTKFGDPRVKLLLMAIHEDEIKHHKVLISIRDNVTTEYVINEEDMWNAIWRDSPWHGTPGG
ncbi:MAG: ferritin-like domain-containing protein [Ignisphaera sp.]